MDMASAGSGFAPYELAGPSLLAAQPTTPKDTLPHDADDWLDTIYQHCETTRASLYSWRWSWWSHWARLAEFFKPRRYHWFITPNRMNKGNYINDAILDGTGGLAVNTCASGMWAGLTNPARPWLKIEAQDPTFVPDADAQKWFDDLGRSVLTVYEKSNYYTEMAQAFEDLAVFGTAPVTMYEDYDDIIRLYLPCAGEYMLAVGARNTVDTQLREYNMTIRQMVEWFTFEKCPPEVQKAWMEGGARLNEEMTINHLIEPNFELQGKNGKKVKVVPGKFIWREIYWIRGNPTPAPLSRRGFYDAPFFVLRWSKVSNDAYGRSPCMDALGDAKQVQRETLRKGEFIEKLVRPPMGANVELKNEPASTLPGMTTYVNTSDGKKGFWPLYEVQAPALGPLVQDIALVNNRIEKALFVDVFMAITQMQGVEPRNELELTKRDLERLQKLGPVINLVENALAQGVMRTIAILQRRKMVRPMPESLNGVGLKLTFESLMRLAQRSAEAQAMKDTFGVAGALSSAAKAAGVPDPIRTMNLDKALQRFGLSNNFPIDCFFTKQEVEEHDQAREQAKAAAQAPAAAMAGVQAAKTLSDTQVPGGTALGALMGGNTLQ